MSHVRESGGRGASTRDSRAPPRPTTVGSPDVWRRNGRRRCPNAGDYLHAHASHVITPPARPLTVACCFNNDSLLAVRDPDGELTPLLQNELSEPTRTRIMVGGESMTVTRSADSW